MTTKKFTIQGTAKTEGATVPLSRLKASLDGTRDATEALNKRFGGLGGAIEGFHAKASSAISIVSTLASTVDGLVQQSFRLQNVQQNLPYAIDKARASTQGLVKDFELSRLAITANRLGVAKSAEDFAKLTEIATKLGVSMGEDATKSVQDLVEGLGKGSPEVLNNIGIIVKAEAAYAAYSATIGKLPKDLTDAEKQQAIVNAGLEEGARLAADITIQMDDATRAWMEAKTEWGNIADETLPVVTEGFARLGRGINNASDALLDLMLRTQEWEGSLPQISGLLDRVEKATARQRDAQETEDAEAFVQGLFDAEEAAIKREAAELEQLRKEMGRKRGGGGGSRSQRKVDGNTAGNRDLQALQDSILGDIGGRLDRAGALIGAQAEGFMVNTEARQEQLAAERDFQAAKAEIQLNGQLRAIEMQREEGVDPLTLIDEEENARISFLEGEMQRTSDQIEQMRLLDQVKAEHHSADMKRMAVMEARRKKHQEMVLGYTHALQEATIGVGAAALQAALMGEGGVRAAVHGFAKGKSIEMVILAASETARGLAALASPFTAALAPGHFAAAGQAAAAGALIGVVAGVTAGGGGGGPGGSRAFGFGGGERSVDDGRRDSFGPAFTGANFGSSTGTRGSPFPHAGAMPLSNPGGGQTINVTINSQSLAQPDHDALVLDLRRALQHSDQRGFRV